MCRRQASDRDFLKGITGDIINVLMAACAWNLNKWLRRAFLFLFALLFGDQKLSGRHKYSNRDAFQACI